MGLGRLAWLCVAAQALAGLGFLALSAGGLRPSLATLVGFWAAVAAAEIACLLLGLARRRPLVAWPQVPLPVWLVGGLATAIVLLTAIRSFDLAYDLAAAVGVAVGLLAELSLLRLWPRLRRLPRWSGQLTWRLTAARPAAGAAAPAGGALAALLLCLAGAGVLVFLLAVPRLAWVNADLDGAWMRIVPWAQERGLAFGRDLVFTYGPLGWLHTPPAASGLLDAKLVYAAALALLLGSGLWLLAERRWCWPLLPLWLLLLVNLPHDYNSAYVYALALLAFLVGREPGRLRLAWSVAACGLLAVMALGKLSHLPPILLVLLALDLDRWLRRRSWPLFLPLFLIQVELALAVAGQPLTGLLDLLRTLRLFGAGYAQAMQIDLGAAEAPPLLAMLVVLVALASLSATRQALADPAASRRLLLLPLVTLAVAYFAWKAGMVRGHLSQVWPTVVAMGLLALLGPLSQAFARPAAGRLAVLAFSFGALLLHFDSVKVDVLALEGRAIAPHLQVRFQMGQGLVTGQAWKALDLQAAEVDAKLRAAQPWPALAGDVDVLGNHQLPVLAWGLDYRPRPVMQSYAAYNPALAQLNLDHYRSAAAPRHVLDDWAMLDRHWPGSEDGPVRLELMARYRLVGMAGSYLQFVRRAAPRSLVLEPLPPLELRFGETIEVPPYEGVLFARFSFRRELSGRLAELLWRAPQIHVLARLQQGPPRRHVIVPGMAAAGFLLQPLVGDPVAAGLFYASDGADPALLPARLRSLTLELPKGGRWFYDATVQVSLWRVVLGPDVP